MKPHMLSSNSLFLSCSFETQRNGLVFIYDMAGSNYTNFELDLSKKILNLLKVSFCVLSICGFPVSDACHPFMFKMRINQKK